MTIQAMKLAMIASRALRLAQRARASSDARTPSFPHLPFHATGKNGNRSGTTVRLIHSDWGGSDATSPLFCHPLHLPVDISLTGAQPGMAKVCNSKYRNQRRDAGIDL